MPNLFFNYIVKSLPVLYPFTAPCVSPKIKDFLNITATMAGGNRAIMPAATVIPY